MKDAKKTIEYLNLVLGNELIAINQYFLHSRMFKDWGLKKLADAVYHESIDEMKHADTLIERILQLNGIPNLQKLGKLLIGENTKEMLSCDLKLEHKAVADLREAIAHCETQNDFNTRQIFTDILVSEEDHIDWIETQLGLIERVGIANYEQSQIEPDTE